MQKTNNEEFRKKYPEVIERLYRTALSENGVCSVLEAISYLQDKKVRKDERNGEAKMDYIKTVNRFFKCLTCLYSSEIFSVYSKDLLEILDCADAYLHDLCDYETVSNMPRIETGYRSETDMTNIVQFMDFYYLNLYYYSGQLERAKGKLEKLLTETIKDVEYLLSLKDAASYINYDCYSIDGLELECVYWQPLSWVCNSEVSDELLPELIHAYEDYLQFLTDISPEYYCNRKVRNMILAGTANDLQNLYEFSLEQMEDEGLFDPLSCSGCYIETEYKMKARIKELEELKKENAL